MNTARPAARASCREHQQAVSEGEQAMSMATAAAGANSASWESRAACLDCDPDLFFPIAPSGPALRQITQAKAICSRCPVRRECLAVRADHTPGPRGVGRHQRGRTPAAAITRPGQRTCPGSRRPGLEHLPVTVVSSAGCMSVARRRQVTGSAAGDEVEQRAVRKATNSLSASVASDLVRQSARPPGEPKPAGLPCSVACSRPASARSAGTVVPAPAGRFHPPSPSSSDAFPGTPSQRAR